MTYNKMGSYLYSRLPHYHKVVDEQERLLQRFMEVLNVGFDINDHNLKLALEKTQASKCGEEYLEELATSMGADWIHSIDPSYQRTIIRMLTQLYKKKGTIDTIRFIASELSGFEATVIEGEIPEQYFKPEDVNKRLLTIKLQAPDLDDPVLAHQHETTISEVIDKFLPVHTKFVLVVTYFYDEPHYKRIQETLTQSLHQDIGESTSNILNNSFDITINRISNNLGMDTHVGIHTYDNNDLVKPIPTHYENLIEDYAEDDILFNLHSTEDVSVGVTKYNTSQSSKVVLKYIQEDYTIKDLQDGYVFILTNPHRTLNNRYNILTTPSFIDKITKDGEIDYNYE